MDAKGGESQPLFLSTISRLETNTLSALVTESFMDGNVEVLQQLGNHIL